MPISSVVLQSLKRGRVFIETGCDQGEGIAAALEAGFARVISIELDAFKAHHATLRFGRAPVAVLHGDTVKLLPKVLAELKEPATLWLDAHGTWDSPILEELQCLEEHGIKDHTILVDDRRLMGTDWATLAESSVRDALLRINPAYTISLADGYAPNDIIVAQVL